MKLLHTIQSTRCCKLAQKNCARCALWKQTLSNWNFHTMCRMVSIRRRSLFR